MNFKVQKRDIKGKKVKTLRKSGIIPATVYGPKKASTDIQFNTKDFSTLLKTEGYSKFIELEIEGDQSLRVLIKDVVKHPIYDYYESVSFYAVDEDSKLNVDVPIIMTGDSPAVALKLGFLVNPIENIAVHCFPKDLPEFFTVDVSTLEKAGDVLIVGDIKLPEGVDLGSSMDKTSAVVYIASPQRVETVEPTAEVEATTPAK